MKSSKRFVLLIIALVLILFFLDWLRNTYYQGQEISPVARIRTIFVFIAAIAIMKLCTTRRGFKIFLIAHLLLWGIFYGLIFLTMHKVTTKSGEALEFYKNLIPLETPLPLIFFWFVDQLFFVENNLFKQKR